MRFERITIPDGRTFQEADVWECIRKHSSPRPPGQGFHEGQEAVIVYRPFAGFILTQMGELLTATPDAGLEDRIRAACDGSGVSNRDLYRLLTGLAGEYGVLSLEAEED